MSRFDRFMVHVDIGTDEKLARLNDSERLCHIAGVLAIAAKSPIRGCLLVGEFEAGAQEIARRAGVSERTAKSTITKLADVGVLVRDEDYDCWRVHNWERFNPEPKPDPTNAERQQRYRDRRRARNAESNAARNGTVTDPPYASAIARARSPEGKEAEGEGKTPLTPQGGIPDVAPVKPKGNRKTDQDKHNEAMKAWAAHHFPGADPRAVESTIVWTRLEEPVTADVLRTAALNNELWASQLGLSNEEAA